MRTLIKKPVNCGLFISQDRKMLDVSAFMTVTATCPKCGTSYNLCGVGHAVNSMVTDAWLESYDFRIEGDIMYIDNSPGLGQRLRLWEAEQY